MQRNLSLKNCFLAEDAFMEGDIQDEDTEVVRDIWLNWDWQSLKIWSLLEDCDSMCALGYALKIDAGLVAYLSDARVKSAFDNCIGPLLNSFRFVQRQPTFYTTSSCWQLKSGNIDHQYTVVRSILLRMCKKEYLPEERF
jgi:hypothetical protein